MFSGQQTQIFVPYFKYSDKKIIGSASLLIALAVPSHAYVIGNINLQKFLQEAKQEDVLNSLEIGKSGDTAAIISAIKQIKKQPEIEIHVIPYYKAHTEVKLTTQSALTHPDELYNFIKIFAASDKQQNFTIKSGQLQFAKPPLDKAKTLTIPVNRVEPTEDKPNIDRRLTM